MRSSERARSDVGSGATANNRRLAETVTSSRVRRERMVATKICQGLDPLSVRRFKDGDACNAYSLRRRAKTASHRLFVVVLFLFNFGFKFFVRFQVDRCNEGRFAQRFKPLVDNLLDLGDMDIERKRRLVNQ